MKKPVSPVTFYHGCKIVFDGERFNVIDEHGAVWPRAFYTIGETRRFIDIAYSES